MATPTADRNDLARQAPGIRINHEAARRRRSGGLGADRSWRVDADGEAAVADVLSTLTAPGLLDQVRDRLSGRRHSWFALHSVPLGNAAGQERGDIDHVVCGPSGLTTINTKHHPHGRVDIDGDQVEVNQRGVDYIAAARRENQRARAFLAEALRAGGRDDLAAQCPIRSMIVIVGARLIVCRPAPDIAVVMKHELRYHLQRLRPVLDAGDIAALHASHDSPRHGESAGDATSITEDQETDSSIDSNPRTLEPAHRRTAAPTVDDGTGQLPVDPDGLPSTD